MEVKEENTEKDLKKYFKYIKECRNCKRQYGLDVIQKSENGICPVCEKKLWNEKLRLREKKPRKPRNLIEPMYIPDKPEKKKKK